MPVRPAHHTPEVFLEEGLRGITKAEFDKLLNCHMEKADNSVELTKQYIEQMQDYKQRRLMNLALAKLISYLQASKELQIKEQERVSDALFCTKQKPLYF